MEIAYDDRLHDHCYSTASSSVYLVGILAEIVVRIDVLRDNVLQHATSLNRD